MDSAFVTAAPVIPRASNSSVSPRRPHTLRMDAEAPPESRISPNYPPETRFMSPVLNLQSVEGAELLSTIGLHMEVAPLDLEAAAKISAQCRADNVIFTSETEDHPAGFDATPLFADKIIDDRATTPDEKYYPFSRRDETPIINIIPPADGAEDPNSGAVELSIGKVEATPPPEKPDPREPAFWRKIPAGGPSVHEVINRAYPVMTRYEAPFFTVNSPMSISIEMSKVFGEPDPSLYPKTFDFHAPAIKMKAPKGEWDDSAFISVSSEELQLPILDTVQ